MPERDLYRAEHEIRCDAFAEDVRKRVVEKYSQLDFRIINPFTEGVIDKYESGLSEFIEQFETSNLEDDPLKESYIKNLKRRLRDKVDEFDIKSAHMNYTNILIWGWEEELKEDIREAVSYIVDVAEDHLPNEYELITLDTTEIPYHARLTVTFSSEGE